MTALSATASLSMLQLWPTDDWLRGMELSDVVKS